LLLGAKAGKVYADKTLDLQHFFVPSSRYVDSEVRLMKPPE
jgi:hypothetical protein